MTPEILNAYHDACAILLPHMITKYGNTNYFLILHVYTKSVIRNERSCVYKTESPKNRRKPENEARGFPNNEPPVD